MLDCLIIDDDIHITSSVCEYFSLSDISCQWAADYESGLKAVQTLQPSLILLDVNLGGQSGFALCKRLRETCAAPVLFLSARTADSDILMGLGVGGDDYITKPFSLPVLLAKVRAVLKRSAGQPSLSRSIMRLGGLEIDKDRRRILREGQPVKLKPLENKLLFYLIDHPGQTVTKDELLEKVWQDAFTSEGTLSVHIRRLREKLEDTPDQPRYIKTIWGSGYRFEDKE